MKIKKVLRQIISFGMEDILNVDDNKKANPNAVIAGDPVHRIEVTNGLFPLSDQEKKGLFQFYVDGNSMSPCNINSGDNLLALKIDSNTYQVQKGDFLILRVDPSYYQDEIPNYDYKLRRVIMPIKKEWTEEDIINKLKESDGEEQIWLYHYQKNLRKKYKKAKRHYTDCDLVLSCTYRNGLLDYSFHRLESIAYKVEKVIKKKNKLTYIDASKIA